MIEQVHGDQMSLGNIMSETLKKGCTELLQ